MSFAYEYFTAMAEKRVDPANGIGYAKGEFRRYYTNNYKAVEIEAYLTNCNPLSSRKGADTSGPSRLKTTLNHLTSSKCYVFKNVVITATWLLPIKW